MTRRAGARIAILFHERARRRLPPRSYAIHHIAKIWSTAGHDVRYVFGVKESVPADVLIVHVDLSVVPEEYLAYARRYPVVLNGGVKDIRKSTFSNIRVGRGDRYPGKVIVKSDLNYAGLPERLLTSGRLRTQLGRAWSALTKADDYRVYDNLQMVPPACFDRPDVIVEKFVPEIEGGLYCVRVFHFLGDRATSVRIGSPQPVVKAGTRIQSTPVEPHPALLEWRRGLKIDFGKFDYVVHDGAAVLLDANKTPGEGRVISDRARARVRLQAEGLRALITYDLS